MSFTRRGNTLYAHVHFWPGSTMSICGLMTKVKSVNLLAGGQKVGFEQDRLRLRLTGLPEKAPDDPVTTLAIECESEPKQDQIFVRKEHERREA
jgi:alpha-L-fucosidase